MSSCCRRNPTHSYGLGDVDGQWSAEQIARSLEAGVISPERANELMASLGANKVARQDNREELVGRAMGGDATAIATLQSYGLDWTQMTKEQDAYRKKKMMKYGAAAAGIGALAYFFTKGKK